MPDRSRGDLGRGDEPIRYVARRGLRESVVQLGRVPADRRVEPVLVLRREDPTEGGERGALQRSGKVVASAVECPGDCNGFSSN